MPPFPLPLFGSNMIRVLSPMKFLPFQEVALDDTLLAWPGPFDQWMRGLLQYSSKFNQLLDEYSTYIQLVLELFQYVFHLLQTKFCNSLSPMCCVGFDVFFPFQYHMSPWASKLLYSFIIHRCRRSRRRFVSIILLLSPFYTHSLPAIKHLHPQNLVS